MIPHKVIVIPTFIWKTFQSILYTWINIYSCFLCNYMGNYWTIFRQHWLTLWITHIFTVENTSPSMPKIMPFIFITVSIVPLFWCMKVPCPWLLWESPCMNIRLQSFNLHRRISFLSLNWFNVHFISLKRKIWESHLSSSSKHSWIHKL